MSKSGVKRIFQAADVNTPPGALDIVEEGEIFLHLSKKILDYPEYQQWLIKIDKEHSGRGTAVLDVSRIKCLSEENRMKVYDELVAKNQTEIFVDMLRDKLYFELREHLGSKVRYVSYAYSDWHSFVRAFRKNGGVIEAAPSNIIGSCAVHLLIEPNGEMEIIATQEQVYCYAFCAYNLCRLPVHSLQELEQHFRKVPYHTKHYEKHPLQWARLCTKSTYLAM